jgi:hypothetical protein
MNTHRITCGKDMLNLASDAKKYHYIRLNLKVELNIVPDNLETGYNKIKQTTA